MTFEHHACREKAREAWADVRATVDFSKPLNETDTKKVIEFRQRYSLCGALDDSSEDGFATGH